MRASFNVKISSVFILTVTVTTFAAVARAKKNGTRGSWSSSASADREEKRIGRRHQLFRRREPPNHGGSFNLDSLVKKISNNDSQQQQDGESTVTVRISQSIIGQCDNSRRKGQEASVLMATWLDPDTKEVSCGFKKRNVGPCFERTIQIGCDPTTNRAPIDIYIKDKDFFRPPSDYRVDNPNVSKVCRLGRKSISESTIHFAKQFDCASSTLLLNEDVNDAESVTDNSDPINDGEDAAEDNAVDTCDGTEDSCSEGTYCKYMGRKTDETSGSVEFVYECHEYVKVGEICGGNRIGANGQREDLRCDPESSYCRYPSDSCIKSDMSGRCAPLGNACSSDDDCVHEKDYCDEDAGRCKKRLPVGSCCSPEQDQCVEGSNCESKGNSQYLCYSVDSNETDENTVIDSTMNAAPCGGTCSGSNQHCTFKESVGEDVCMTYANIGDECDISDFFIGGEQPDLMCNPTESFCWRGDKCYNTDYDLKGKCIAYGESCISSDSCPENSWCDMAIERCKPQLQKSQCCQIENESQCAEGLVCVEQYFSGISDVQHVCRTECENGDGECVQSEEFCTFGDSYYGIPPFCKPYAKTGDGCNFFTTPQFFEVCNSQSHYCRDTEYCYIADKGGECVQLGNACTSSIDCESPSIEWCDKLISRCKPKYEEGSCCENDIGDEMCAEGTICINVSDRGAFFCAADDAI